MIDRIEKTINGVLCHRVDIYDMCEGLKTDWIPYTPKELTANLLGSREQVTSNRQRAITAEAKLRRVREMILDDLK